MRVTLIAKTELTGGSAPKVLDAAPDWAPEGWTAEDADLLVEFAGRSCYQSWSNPSGRSNAEYIGNIIDQGHFSVLEHASATFYIEGVSRSLTHELVRHRHFSFSQLSQRFVKMEGAGYVVPPALAPHLGQEVYDGTGSVQSMFDQSATIKELLDDAFDDAKSLYTTLVAFLEGKGLPRKQAREAARAVLPNMVETSLVVTGNHRSWREFVQKRFTMHADAEIRELAGIVLGELRRIAPNIYQDFGTEPTE